MSTTYELLKDLCNKAQYNRTLYKIMIEDSAFFAKLCDVMNWTNSEAAYHSIKHFEEVPKWQQT